MNFDLVDLKLFVHITEENSLTRGAARTCLSLPAASLRMKNLEQAVGTRLFDRSNQGITLRPAGQTLLHHARQVLHQLQSLRGDLHEYAEGIRGHLRVLVNTTAVTDSFPEVLRTFLIEHPDVNIDLREKLSAEIVRSLMEGTSDIGIVASSVRTESLQLLPYRQDRLVLVTPLQHPLHSAPSVAFSETLEFDFVGLQEGSAVQLQLEEAAQEMGKRILIRIQLGSYAMVGRMVEAGIGVAILPESTAVRLAAGNMQIRVIALQDSWAVRDLVLCVRDLAALPPFGKALVQLLQDEADERRGVVRARRINYS